MTWSSQPEAVGAAVASWSQEGYMQWNVSAQVAEMYAAAAVDHGFVVRDAAEGTETSGEHDFHSREKGESPPFLVIRFGAPAVGRRRGRLHVRRRRP